MVNLKKLNYAPIIAAGTIIPPIIMLDFEFDIL